jgi:hypothetical protein
VPAVLDRRKVTLIDDGLPRLPYHHDCVGMPEDEANARIARVRRSIAARTARALRQVMTDLAPAHVVVGLAIRQRQLRPVAAPDLPASDHGRASLNAARL